MNQLLIKRLEVIRNLILLEDFEDVPEHAEKLKALCFDDKTLCQIISCINAAGYGEAVRLIEKYLQANLGLVIYSDPEVEALRLEIRHIEREVSNLQAEKSEIERLIHKFNVTYHQKLGTLVSKLLTLKKDRLKQKAEKIDAHAEEQHNYEEAQKDYDTFNRAYEETKQTLQVSLSDAEQFELKKIYRKACLLCHPDMVSPENIEKAKKVFIELNEAYTQQDLNMVLKIYDMLKSGNIFSMFTETTDDKNLLRAKALELKAVLARLSKEVEQLKQNDTYQLIISIENWDDYFSDIRQQLEEQVAHYLP